MNASISVLPEPKILFGDNRAMTDPHAGLSLFGPYDKCESSHPEIINYAIVGTENGISMFSALAKLIQCPVLHESFSKPFVSLEIERL